MKLILSLVCGLVLGVVMWHGIVRWHEAEVAYSHTYCTEVYGHDCTTTLTEVIHQQNAWMGGQR